MHVVFRADASVEIGTGHIFRCLTLADSISCLGATCEFVCRNHPGNLVDLIRDRGFLVRILPEIPPTEIETCFYDATAHSHWLGTSQNQDAADTIRLMQNNAVDWIVVDHYGLDAAWERQLKRHCQHLAVIDDLADRSHEADVLIDQNWLGPDNSQRYCDLVPPRCHCLLGPEFALLKPEYGLLRQWLPERNGQVKRVLVFMGGSDPSNETCKVLDALADEKLRALAVDVVVGINHIAPELVSEKMKPLPCAALYKQVESLAGLMFRADLMIGGGGVTTWERMCLGLPTLVVSIADNQVRMNRVLHQHGFIEYLGENTNVDKKSIVEVLTQLTGDNQTLVSQSRKGQALVKGDGAKRVSQFLLTGC